MSSLFSSRILSLNAYITIAKPKLLAMWIALNGSEPTNASCSDARPKKPKSHSQLRSARIS